jgi:hypothetical protein
MKLSKKLIQSSQKNNLIIGSLILFMVWSMLTVLFGTNVRDILYPVLELFFIITMLKVYYKKFNKVISYIINNEKVIMEKYQIKSFFSGLSNYYFAAFDKDDAEKMFQSPVGEDFIACFKFYKKLLLGFVAIFLIYCAVIFFVKFTWGIF